MAATKLQKEYIQFSKRVTKWGMILMTVTVFACLAVIAFCGLDSHAVAAVSSLYTAFVTVLGVTIGAYQGNSSIEKWTKAKYQYDELLKKEDEDDDDSEEVESEETEESDNG